LPTIERPELMEEISSGDAGAAESATVERCTCCADEESRLFTPLPLDLPNMLLPYA